MSRLNVIDGIGNNVRYKIHEELISKRDVNLNYRNVYGLSFVMVINHINTQVMHNKHFRIHFEGGITTMTVLQKVNIYLKISKTLKTILGR